MLPLGAQTSSSKPQGDDAIADKLKDTAQNIIAVIFGLLPILFIPLQSAPVEYSKVLIASAGLFIALILFSLSVLRSGVILVPRSLPLLLLWFVVLVAGISSLLSGDIRDSLFGDSLGVHTTGFLALLVLTVTIWSVVGPKKASVMRLYMLLAASTFILVIYHLLRLAFGADFLSFGIFTNSVSSPIGSWNDLALFLGLTVLLSLITLMQLSLTSNGRLLFAGVIILALAMLAVINFLYVWVILALISLVILVYTLGKDRFLVPKSIPADESKLTPVDMTTLLITILVFGVSVLFLLGGSILGSFIADRANVSYVEVRPSLEATAGIVRDTYGDNALLGVGPNKFVDAWRLYKNEAINATVFWNTNFLGGSGYIPTFFVTMGILGVIAWIAFILSFAYMGLRLLLRSNDGDKMWYYIATSAFAGAAYIWLMSFLYIPGAVVLLIGALCTGVTIVASQMIGGAGAHKFEVGSDKRMAFVMTLIIIGLIVGSVASLYGVGRHYASAYIFSESVRSLQTGVSIENIELETTRALELYQSDVYARRITEYQLAKINTLLSLTDPGVEEQQEFQEAIARGIEAGTIATEVDPTEPENWAVLGRIYTILSGAQIEGAYDRALEVLTRARDLDPTNPLRYLELAQLEAQVGNFEGAREFINEAMTRKTNYVDALTLLTQIEISSGNTNGAVQSTRAMISLEPSNPARYYQLGVLESAGGNVDAAIEAFEEAVRLDRDFSNARYYLALAYEASGRGDEAIEQLQRVLQLNPGNQDVISLIQQIEANEQLQGVPQLQQREEVETSNSPLPDDRDEVVTDTEVDSPLLTPVNTQPETETEEESFDLEATPNEESATDEEGDADQE